jgi:hypothetical protein
MWSFLYSHLMQKPMTIIGPSVLCAPAEQTKVATVFITFFMEYNRPDPEYNRPDPEYNRPDPEYNRPDPEYNRPDLLTTAIQLVTLSTCILIRINSATRQEPVCTTILPTAAWLSVDWQTGFLDANANGGPHSGTPILFFIVGFPPKIGLFQTVFIFI